MSAILNKREFPRDSWDPALRKSLTVLHDGYRNEIRERDRLQQRIDSLATRLWIAGGALGFTATVLAGVILLLFENR